MHAFQWVLAAPTTQKMLLFVSLVSSIKLAQSSCSHQNAPYREPASSPWPQAGPRIWAARTHRQPNDLQESARGQAPLYITPLAFRTFFREYRDLALPEFILQVHRERPLLSREQLSPPVRRFALRQWAPQSNVNVQLEPPSSHGHVQERAARMSKILWGRRPHPSAAWCYSAFFQRTKCTPKQITKKLCHSEKRFIASFLS